MPTPPLPPGYELDQPSGKSSAPPLPPGYQLDSPPAAAAPVQAPQGPPPGLLDQEIPLSSYGNAALSGLQSIGRGTRDAVKGAISASIPKNGVEGAIAALAPGFGLPAYNMAKGLLQTGNQAAQLPAAVSDINQSSDPLGYYAKAGQETAGQGAGQALTALATEGAIRGGPPVIRGGATAINKVLAKAPSLVGGAVGGTLGGAIGHHFGMTGLGAEIGAAAGGIAERAVPTMQIPGENFGLPKPTYPGASLPTAPSPELIQANALTQGSRMPAPDPAAALAKIANRSQSEVFSQKVPAPNPSMEADTGPALSDQSVPVGKTPKAGQRPDGPYSGPRTPVMESTQSGHLQKIGYHPDTQTAVVEFPNGKVYEYRGVPQEVFDNMKNAESQGSFFAQNLKGRYETNYRGAVKPLTAGAKAKQALLRNSSSLGGQ